MFLKRLLLISYGIAGLSTATLAQANNFCNGITKILADGKSKFDNTRGERLSVNETGITWASKVDVQGVIKARFVSAMGLFYEGAVFQTKNIDEIPAIYDKYKTQLSDCLLNKGYKLSTVDNFNAGLAQYKKLVFMNMNDEAALPPPHVSMEVTYYKPGQLYTIVIYIYEH